MPFSGPKWCICPEQNFFGTNYYYYFHLAIGPFHCAKLKKIVTMDPELWGCTIFGPKMVPFAPHKFFFWKLLISFSSTYYSLSLCKILKRFFQLIQSYENLQFLGPKWPIFLNGHLKKKKPVNEPCFFNLSLSIFHKWKPDINLLLKYWWLKNTEISLAESHFWL